MITDERDIEKIIKLAREGKQISKIWEDDFSQYDYWDIYFEIHEAGEKSALGTKRKITHRLNKLKSLPKRDQQDVIEEIRNLVDHLYVRYKEGQKKIEQIRNVVDK
ncbi:hypothetical protein V7124_25895 [Neobacillus niacini]|uniref:hypothetical protein n=1 Tax=Neobacillus niacini TaxID=86668 RepID=UPI002FFF14D1